MADQKISVSKQKKVEVVKELTDKVGKAKSMIFVDYLTIKHKQLEALRKTMKKSDAEFAVTKNKLFMRALGDKATQVSPMLTQTTGTLFNYGDEVGGLKDLLKFFKTVGAGKTKGGILGDTVLTAKDVDNLSKLPGKTQLIGQLAGQLLAPISHLHYALSWNINKLVWGLNSIKNKKQ